MLHFNAYFIYAFVSTDFFLELIIYLIYPISINIRQQVFIASQSAGIQNGTFLPENEVKQSLDILSSFRSEEQRHHRHDDRQLLDRLSLLVRGVTGLHATSVVIVFFFSS